MLIFHVLCCVAWNVSTIWAKSHTSIIHTSCIMKSFQDKPHRPSFVLLRLKRLQLGFVPAPCSVVCCVCLRQDTHTHTFQTHSCTQTHRFLCRCVAVHVWRLEFGGRNGSVGRHHRNQTRLLAMHLEMNANEKESYSGAMLLIHLPSFRSSFSLRKKIHLYVIKRTNYRIIWKEARGKKNPTFILH